MRVYTIEMLNLSAEYYKNTMKENSYNLKIILLAAGRSERFNGIKLLAKAQQDDSATLIQHVLQQISVAMDNLKINKNNLHVATGIYHPKIAKSIGEQFSATFCEQAEKGMGHTIAQSVKNVLKSDDNPSHIMITLADQVALTSADYIHLIKQSLAAPNKLICAEVAGELSKKSGKEIMPPAIFSSKYFADLMVLQGDKGAKPLLYTNENNLLKVSLPNAAIDIDTLQELINWHKVLKD